MSHILTIVGGACGAAKSSAILDFTHQFLRRRGVHASSVRMRSLPIEDLVNGIRTSDAIEFALRSVDCAEAIVLIAPAPGPVCFEGLKAFLEMLPLGVLRYKAVLPIATGQFGALSHGMQRSAKSRLIALDACPILPEVCIADSQVQFGHGGGVLLDEHVECRHRLSLESLIRYVGAGAFRAEPYGDELLWEGFER